MTVLQNGGSADYVIVGAGSAGAVLAYRLTEDPTVSVTLIEAGGEAKSLLVQLPVGFAKLVSHPGYDWRYLQEADPTINGRRFIWSAGKLLGGGSSINGQVYIRGTRRDYDRWVELGANGWSFDEVLPWFRRSEDWAGPPHPAHGQGGPLSTAPMQDFHPLCHTFMQACNEHGLPTLADYHGGDMEGVYLTSASQRDGWRCSTEKAFLRPARKRPNLRVLTHTEVERIHFDGSRAIGVDVVSRGLKQRIEARAEVIVSSGTVGSCALLMRSGIGAGETLRKVGVDVVRDLPGVGRNLQEHASVGQNKFVNLPTLNSELGAFDMIRHLLRFAAGKKGPLGAPAVQAMGLARTRPELDEPDVQLHFLPLAYDIAADTVSTASALMPKEPTVTINATICQPRSRGRVELDAQRRPKILHRFFDDERDVATLVGGQKLIAKLFDTPALRRIVIADRAPASPPADDAAWADYVRNKAAPAYHPVGTCRMGRDDMAVVDPATLKVHGIDGLRVIDASVIPSITSANTNAAAIMIGERGADMISRVARR
ncbi:MAG: hypothetical protein JWQ90_2600 [Hydrocarboniphaga sp.]|uniref:GMC family oxidoreductase n=1 Tax=Hydrocarboniphaga sp. TaxID=2033016 RepID=UPI00261E846D|nr:GMC family oxidoreductase N-terminal domain-containing protein [Hydrocarboniphaga sp.]MDB5970150.1 hypothetical protein [Hydrocarboniphaga sp.]